MRYTTSDGTGHGRADRSTLRRSIRKVAWETGKRALSTHGSCRLKDKAWSLQYVDTVDGDIKPDLRNGHGQHYAYSPAK